MCLSGSCIVQYIHDHFRRQFKQPAAIGARPAQGNIEGRCQGAKERQGRGTWGEEGLPALLTQFTYLLVKPVAMMTV